MQAMKEWMDVADQIVVVDSFSTDGTLEYLKEHLSHPRVSFLQHPPGLYESWNFGIQQLKTEFAYISTVGDTITRHGLKRLLEVAVATQAGIVISKPQFIEEDGRSSEGPYFALDDLIATRKITQPRLLHPLEVIAFTATNLGAALSGSCASDLFRTSVLEQFPFPVTHGHGSDGAWSVLHVADVKWAVTPEKFSTFVLHAKSPAARQAPDPNTARRLDLLLGDVLPGCEPKVKELLGAATNWMNHKEEFDRLRKRPFPWSLRPGAWRTRLRRDAARRDCIRLQTQILSSLES